MSAVSTTKNALARETSPYLQQHADNPVEWFPWGPEALERARQEDKPILLSIGYSACHWCHVMAHESFEHTPTAAVMNRSFVNIKVDREERPDLDRIYQMAHHILTRRSGGWPLTMFLDPQDHTPFFGGTFFPRESRYGLPGFVQLLDKIAEVFQTQREGLQQQNASLRDALAQVFEVPGDPNATITSQPLHEARENLGHNFDTEYGGFGAAPKFPHPTSLQRLLRHYAATGINKKPDQEALNMALFTLRKMAQGGIYDHLGGGFARYSVDQYWMIPHFEKMLYDNGPLLSLYSEAWQLSGDPLFKQVAIETADWVLRDMQSPEGGFYSSLDADSEGEEGKFYVWDKDELQSLLNEDEYRVFAHYYGIEHGSNFEDKHHLYAHAELAELAQQLQLPAEQVQSFLNTARAKLLPVRNARVWPGRDEKILVSWNALMIKALAIAGTVLQRPDYIAAAERAVDFIRKTMCRDGRLLATYKDGRAHLNAYLDDYAFLIDALLQLLQARWRSEDLRIAIELADTLLRDFEDEENGGFFFTAHDHETLLQRAKPFADDALPAGNGVAALALARLGHLLGETRYLNASARTLSAGWLMALQSPSACTALLAAAEEYLNPPQIIILRGNDPELDRWQARAVEAYAPGRFSVAIPTQEQDLPAGLAARVATDGVVAYVCTGSQCLAPTNNFDDFAMELTVSEVPRSAS
jgi:hypothetical protein